MYTEHAQSRPVLIWLDDDGATYPTSVGQKAAALATLGSHGFTVPQGFVVTADAYRAVVDAAGIDAALSYPASLCRDACTESRFRTGLLAQVETPPHLVAAMADAYAELGRRAGGDDPAVAVRASVVDEELTFGPTAPALTGIVGLPGVTEAVAACWCALFNEQAIKTRAALKQQFSPAMAVLVQELVSTLRSGTALSTDPVRRGPDLVRITASFGDGPARTRPIPDTYLVTRRSNELVELSVAEKASGRSPFQRVLTDEQASQVTVTLLDVEKTVGRPLAMDWSLAEDATVVVLEVRPMPGHVLELDRRRPA